MGRGGSEEPQASFGLLRSEFESEIQAHSRKEMEAKDETLKSPIAISCAKAAMLLSSLKSSPNHHLESANDDEDEEKEMMRREIGYLRLELARERLKRKRIKLCGLMELILQVVVLMISSFFLILAFKSS